MARLVHCKKEKYDIYIGRPSLWGNPFSHKDGTLATYKVDTVEEAISRYEQWVMEQPEILEAIYNLNDEAVLGCWCYPKPCHGDVILKILSERKNVR